MEASQCFTDNGFFDIMYHKNFIFRIAMKKSKYDFIHPSTSESRLSIEVKYKITSVHGNLKASGVNCDNLKMIYLDFLLPNYIK
jgi:hypothetical protein